VTTAGGVEEDFIKCLAPTYIGDFALNGRHCHLNIGSGGTLARALLLKGKPQEGGPLSGLNFVLVLRVSIRNLLNKEKSQHFVEALNNKICKT
jgi:hypothetical protein